MFAPLDVRGYFVQIIPLEMEHTVTLTGNNLGRKASGNLIQSFRKRCLKFQAEIIRFAVTQPIENSRELSTAIKMPYGCAEKYMF